MYVFKSEPVQKRYHFLFVGSDVVALTGARLIVILIALRIELVDVDLSEAFAIRVLRHSDRQQQ